MSDALDPKHAYEKNRVPTTNETMMRLIHERDEARAEVERLRPLAEIGAAVQRLEEWRDSKYGYEYRIESLSTDGEYTLFKATLWDLTNKDYHYAAIKAGQTIPAAIDAALKVVEG